MSVLGGVFWGFSVTMQKVSVFGVFLVRIFPHLPDLPCKSAYSVRMRENSEYGHFSRSKWCKKYLITSYLIFMLGDIPKLKTESHVCPLISQELESILDFFSGLTRLITVQRNVARECYENFCPKCIYISNVLNSWGINHSKTWNKPFYFKYFKN